MSAPHETVQAKPSNLNTTVLDETKLSIQGVDHYVWVLTDGLHVVFRLVFLFDRSVSADTRIRSGPGNPS